MPIPKSTDEKAPQSQGFESMNPDNTQDNPARSQENVEPETHKAKTELNENSVSEPVPTDKIQWLSHGPKFRMLSEEQQSWISKIHHNLGHPSAQKLQNVLR